MLKNAYLLAKIGADTAEIERIFAKMLPKLATTQQMSDFPLDPAGAQREPPVRRLPRDQKRPLV